jgi:quercetin dioxygenase-like cupin family protein
MFYFRRRTVFKVVLSLYLILAFPVMVNADGFNKALIKDIINDVYVYENITVEKPNRRVAQVKDVLKPKMALRTAPKSRAELVFQDGTLVRVGTDAMLSFNTEKREINMGSGTALIQQHTTNQTTNIRTATVTASITGTTAMVQNSPGQFQRALVIEGQMKMSMDNGSGSSRTLSSGDMVIIPPDANSIPEPVKVSLDQVASSSALINSFDDDSDEDEDQGTGTQQETTGSDQTDGEADNGTDQEAGSGTTQTDDGQEETGGTFDQGAVEKAVNEQNQQIEDGELVQTNVTVSETDEGDDTNQTEDATESQTSSDVLAVETTDDNLTEETESKTTIDLSKSNQSQYESFKSKSSYVAYSTDGLSVEFIGDGPNNFDFADSTKAFCASTGSCDDESIGPFVNSAKISMDKLAIHANQIGVLTGADGSIEIGDVKLKAVNAISMLAEGTGSSIRFVDNAQLIAGTQSGEGSVFIAGSTVKIENGVTVDVDPGINGTLAIGANGRNYNVEQNGEVFPLHDQASGNFNLQSGNLSEISFDQLQEAIEQQASFSESSNTQ